MTAWIVRLSQHDERALHALVLRRRRWVGAVMHTVTHLGDAATTIAASALLLTDVVPGFAQAGQEAAFTLVVSHLLVQVVKRTISRPRPRLPEGVASLIRAPDRFSFPSGHSAAAFSLALPVAAVVAAPLAVTVVALALLVALSRCYLGVHYPGDVLAGIGLAAATAPCAGPVLALL